MYSTLRLNILNFILQGATFEPNTVFAVFRIHDILVRIRILGFVYLANGSGSSDWYLWLTDPDSALFVFSLKFLSLFLFGGTLHLHTVILLR